MVGKTGFFGGAVPHSSFIPSKSRTLVDLGGTGDCGFRAIAAGLIDNIINFPSSNNLIAERLVALHANYFSHPLLNGRPRQATEQIKDQMQQPSRQRFISELAYALRQLEVDELCHHPEYYRGAFVSQHEGTDPASMRRSETWIDESGIAALSVALAVPIQVNFIHRTGEVPLRFEYGKELSVSSVNTVTIQLKNGHYQAELLRPDFFTGMHRSHLDVVRSEPLSINKAADPSLTDILQRIEASDRQILDEFEKARNRLEIMVAAGEINKNELMNLYIKGMATSDYLEGRVKYIGLEHGNQDFFEALEQARGGAVLSHSTGKGAEDAVTAELIHALARAISIGQMDATLVDDEGLGVNAYR